MNPLGSNYTLFTATCLFSCSVGCQAAIWDPCVSPRLSWRKLAKGTVGELITRPVE